jgi:hypothetical protein
MAYEIPKNLTKYSEVFLWGMSFKHFAYAAFYVIIVALVIIQLDAAIWVKILILLPVTALAFMLLFGKLEDKYANKRNLDNSLQNIAYYDRKIDTFMDVKEIKDNLVLLKNGAIVAILRMNPIDFSILSDSQKEYVLNSYRQWLRSLGYPVQIVSRSVNIEVNKWMDNLSEKETVQKHKQHFKVFKDWMYEQMESLSVRNRLFYVLIPLKTQLSTKQPFFSQMADLIKGKSFATAVDTDDPAYQKALKNLNDRVKNCQDMLKACGLRSEQLTNADLLELYASYFTNVAKLNENLMTPVMWLKKTPESNQNKAFKKVVKSET